MVVGRDKKGYFYIFDKLIAGRATGLMLAPVTKQEKTFRTTEKSLGTFFELLWHKMGCPGELSDFARTIYRERGDNSIWDFTGKEHWDILRSLNPCDDILFFHCLRCGVIFNVSIDWLDVYQPELLWCILDANEGRPDGLEQIISSGAKNADFRAMDRRTGSKSE